MRDGDEDLSARVLNPRRPRLADALACVTDCDAAWWRSWGDLCDLQFDERSRRVGFELARAWQTIGPAKAQWGNLEVTDPAEAWEAFATRGVIPDAWVGDERRVFDAGNASPQITTRKLPDGATIEVAVTVGSLVRTAHVHVSMKPVVSMLRGAAVQLMRTWPHPPTVAACVALASDVSGLLAAEQLAREVFIEARSLAAKEDAAHGTIACPERVVWRVDDALACRIHRAKRREKPAQTERQRDLDATGYLLGRFTDDAIVLVCPALDAPAADLAPSPMRTVQA